VPGAAGRRGLRGRGETAVHTGLLKAVPGWSGWKHGLIKEGKAETVEGIGDEAAFAKDGNGDDLVVAR
jgi:hypothetical protein